ncbi:hypothetical protein [Spongiactinospora gelatinilytica]|uniref:hypothetical protein n=1 Tax=Spongiactinospora gelatinilytica TaxID=2666298 RepID=UPI001314BDC9|nr:hypothetical protein [Spongiactinospora gelatinilytica]
MSTLQFIAALVGLLAWPVALVVAVIVLRRPLGAAFGRVKRVEGVGLALELAEAEQAREAVEGELAQQPSGVDVDELVRLAADLGFELARLQPDRRPALVIDRSGQRPVVRSAVEERLRPIVDLLTGHPVKISGDYYSIRFHGRGKGMPRRVRGSEN